MFVAAPGLIRAIWRLDPRKKRPTRRPSRRCRPRNPTGRRPKGAQHDRRQPRHRASTSSTRTRPPYGRRAAPPGSAAIAFAVLGLFAFNLALQSFDTPAKFSFWIDQQGGAALDIQTSVGVLWILAGIVTGATGLWQLYRGPAFRWRAALGVIVLLLGRGDLRGRCSPARRPT